MFSNGKWNFGETKKTKKNTERMMMETLSKGVTDDDVVKLTLPISV